MSLKQTVIGELSKAEISYIVRGNKFTYEQVKQNIQKFLRAVLKEMIFLLEQWIKQKVPKDTGNLRNDLLQKLHTSYIQNEILRLVLATDVDYAIYVNNMPTMRVRHSGERRGRKILDDPNAVGYFFDKMVEFAKERMMTVLAREKENYFGRK
ncbi:MAG: HK97 gp10 family phage protein [Promethearchaeota archaeon]